MALLHSYRVVRLCCILPFIFGLASESVHAQELLAGPQAATSSAIQFDRLLEPEQPPKLGVNLFAGGLEAGGFSPERYQVSYQGVQLEQGVTQGIGLVGRATGYQLFIHGNFSNPLQPTARPSARLNFARLQGGLELTPLAGSQLYILGGRDVGDSNATSIEGDLVSWLFASTAHPSNVLVSLLHDYQNGVTDSETDLRVISLSRTNYYVYLGAGGAIYGGGLISTAQGQGGVILGAYHRPFGLGLDLQSGYGSAGQYTQLVLYKTFSLTE